MDEVLSATIQFSWVVVIMTNFILQAVKYHQLT